MAQNPDIQISRHHLQAALDEMSALGIPSTPSNVRVWYEFCEGENEDLSLAISELKNHGIPFDPDLNFELYNRFFGELPSEQLKQFKAELQAITLELGLELSNLATGADDCNKVIDSAEQELEQGCELEALKRITRQLIAETRKVVEQNNQLSRVVGSMQRKVSTLEVNLEKASTEALTDKLTGIANRRAYDEKLDDILLRIKPHQRTCLLMMDIDHFKRFNDTHGHIMGDKVLRFVAQMVKKVIKGKDFLARTGGEEFQLILEDCDLADAINIAEKIRKTIASAQLTQGRDRLPVGNVTVSIGVADLNAEENRNNLINRVDGLLYEAKRLGRNRVVSEANATHAIT